MNTPRIAVVDLETLPASVYTFSLFKPIIGIDQIIQRGRIAGVGWQWLDDKSPQWYSEFDMGREAMLTKVHALVNEADVLIHWNGDRFDIPWVKSEFRSVMLPVPSPFRSIDLMKQTKKHFRLESYKLDYSSRTFLGRAKMATGGFQLWIDCLNGDPRAWKKMGDYCKRDVKLTKDNYLDMLPWISNHPHVGLWSGEFCCPNCGSLDLEKRGPAYVAGSTFQRYRCRSCGAWPRGTKSLSRVSTRSIA